MYPSNSYGNPSFTSTTIKPKALSSFYNYNNDVNLSKTPPSSSSFQLLSPHCITLEDEMILSDLLQQENLLSDDTNILLHQQYSTHDIRACLQSAMEKCNNNGNFVRKDGDGGNDDFKAKKSGTRRRSSKKDRHSKINTAQGPRERRMRLSLDVAKKFFKLQDMLGFDKASKTVEWLLMKSGPGKTQTGSGKLVASRKSSLEKALSILGNQDDDAFLGEKRKLSSRKYTSPFRRPRNSKFIAPLNKKSTLVSNGNLNTVQKFLQICFLSFPSAYEAFVCIKCPNHLKDHAAKQGFLLDTHFSFLANTSRNTSESLHPFRKRVVVQGPGPGPRFGHIMALVGQRYLMAIGGNDGKRPLADVWALDTTAKPYEWWKLEPEGDGPPPCMYVS